MSFKTKHKTVSNVDLVVVH